MPLASSRLPWLLTALAAALVVAALEQWALADFLYWRFVWFDTVMHFLGGLAIGLSLVALMTNRFRPIWFLVLMAGVAIGWEVFEVAIGVTREANYVFDTALDLLMDTLGSLIAYSAARFTIWRSA